MCRPAPGSSDRGPGTRLPPHHSAPGRARSMQATEVTRGPTEPGRATPGRASHFGRNLAIVAALALVVRVAAALFYDNNRGLWGDAFWYSGVAGLIADGHGFVQPIARVALGQNWPTAAHPPLYALYLSVIAHV